MKNYFFLCMLLLLCIANHAHADCLSIVYFDSEPNDGDVALPPSGSDEGIIEQPPNHKHVVGMDYVHWRMETQSNKWQEDHDVSITQGSTQAIDFRVRAEEKEGWTQKNVCIDLYYSDNRWFSRSHDQLLDTECIGTLQPHEKKSAYFSNYSLEEFTPGTHYIFADIRYGNDHNISSRDDKTEYVAVHVIDPKNAPHIDLVAHDLAQTHPVYAGNIYGLRVGITNTGTENAYSGTRGVYQRKDGSAWTTIADDGTDQDKLKSGMTAWEEVSDKNGLRAPSAPGTYQHRFCADSPNYLVESDETNNCAYADITVLPQPKPNLISLGLAVTNGTWVYVNDLYGLKVGVKNIGAVTPQTGSRLNYEININNQWRFLADDGTDASQLAPNRVQWEEVSLKHGLRAPSVPGTYPIRACADYQRAIDEENESDNCTTGQLVVKSRPQPNIVISYVGTSEGARVKRKNKFHPQFWINNSGNGNVMHDVRSAYSINGPGTNYQWQYLDSDGTDAGQLYAGGAAFERINGGVNIPNKREGWYTLRVCGDVYNAEAESNESDNCRESTIYAY